MNLHSYLYPNEPEQETVKLSPETIKMLMDEVSPTVSILRTINRLSDKTRKRLMNRQSSN